MIQSAFRAGFQNFACLSSFAVNAKSSKVVGLAGLRLTTMASKKLHSKSSASSSSSPVAVAKLSEPESVLKGIVGQKEILEIDSDKIEKMTVQQLRVKLRGVGIPAKGSKYELVSAWKGFVNSQINGSLELEDHVSSPKVPNINNPERNAGGLHGGEHVPCKNSVSEVSGIKRTKRKVKEVLIGDENVQIKETQFSTQQQQSVEDQLTGKKSIQKKRKSSLEVACTSVEESESLDSSGEPWTVLTHKKPQKGWVAYNPRTMRPPPLTGDVEHVKLMSWNVNGLRALLKLENFSALQLAQREDFDVLCLQETKLQEKDVEAVKQTLLEGYDNSFWTCSVSKLGYSGAAIISRKKPLSVRYGLGISDHDTEGRLVTAEFDHFYLLCGYVPNSGDGLKRLSYRVTQWDPSLGNYLKELEKTKPVILTGDLNCAYDEIDIYNPAGNKRSAGFTVEERQSFETNFLNNGFVDTFRRQHQGVVGYTYWGYRHGGRRTNKGWRLDYFLVSECLTDKIHDSYILPDVTGSDHSPIGLVVKL